VIKILLVKSHCFLKRIKFFIRVLNRIPITSNNAESWHKNLNEVFSISKPNIAVLITALIDGEE
jgi:hypothetical protein